MDKLISVRFFNVERASQEDPPLAEVLETIGNVDKVENRERKLAPYFDVRLEVFEKDGNDVIVGEMTRIQSTNLPSRIASGKRASLAGVDRLGHSVVFRFNKRKSVLGIQHDRRVLPPFRFFQYVESWSDPTSRPYKFKPVVRDDMWDRFEAKQPKTLIVSVAEPANLRAVTAEKVPALSAMRIMGRAYSAPAIGVRISMGHRKGVLDNSIVATAKSLLGLASSGEIRKLQAKASDERGTDPINLLEELLVDKTIR